MKKSVILILFMGLVLGLSFSKSSLANEKNSPEKVLLSSEGSKAAVTSYARELYYILFDDGCYHLGAVTAMGDGSVWWIPCEANEVIGVPRTICMSMDEYATLC